MLIGKEMNIKSRFLGMLMAICCIACACAQSMAEPLKWKVFAVKRDSVTRDASMPSGNEDLRWVANTATLIYGKTDAVLVDVFLTVDQSNQLAQWIRESGKNLKAIYLTHAHADHIYGAKIIKDHFPEAKVMALPSVVGDIPKQLDESYVNGFWRKLFPGQIPPEFMMPEAMQGHEILLEGEKLIVENIGFSDTANTTFVHVPSIGLVVAGDIVYNGIHPYLVETTFETRQNWIAALDRIASLNPEWVVAGHKVPENPDSPSNVRATRDYLVNFERLNRETETTLDLYRKMLELYPKRVNPGSLWGSARAAKKDSGLH